MEVNMIKQTGNLRNYENHQKAINPKLMGNGYEDEMILTLKVACSYTRDEVRKGIIVLRLGAY